ncbi:unnamed protein product [Haemonchus placei]|uniref:Secreted protein n=1 Tax=Haemonchus placei TaxID=6290 RepID=A0A0N4WYH9_HAEPC|nr:unnamed protein product [Haemonchus placei]
MNFLATIVLLVVCILSTASSTIVREKRQFPYGGFGPYGGFARPYGPYGGGPYGPYGPYSPYGGFRRRPVVVERTIIYPG